MQMRKLLQKTGSTWLPVFVTACFAGACNQVNGMDAQRKIASGAVAQSNADWETICIDRLLIDVPKDVEIASAPLELRSPYVIAGLADRAARGPSWRGLDISETQATDAAGLQHLKEGAVRELAEHQLANDQTVETAKQQIEDWDTRLKRATSADHVAGAKRILDDGKHMLAVANRSKANSGEAKNIASNAFAFRRGDEFMVGFLSPSDGRARTFAGRLTQPELQGTKAVAAQFEQLSQTYQSRKPTQMPAGPGFCSPHGFLKEAGAIDAEASTEILFRSKRYPNLVFKLEVQPATKSKNIQSMPNMAAREALLDIFDVKRSFGPVAVQMLGAPGRLVGQEYKAESCFAPNPCRPPDQAYEFEAETYGEPGNLRRPGVVLSMQALLSDDYKAEQTTLPGNEKSLEIRRGSLKGAVPPDVAQGRAIFERVLNSIRVRPDAIAVKAADT